jgi:hypothetical protein
MRVNKELNGMARFCLQGSCQKRIKTPGGPSEFMAGTIASSNACIVLTSACLK